ncbi:MAG: HAMP domain-containing histidine kinase [Acidobacteria bacterium]|nr:HAMP domain-containing histidine kinase [Acidobacteriota bacterium]MBV9477311.1 HAMP domain-containing histidine kinase [Acidobacteriota bacterium]
MFSDLIERLRALSPRGRRPDRVSILLPFLIISIGLGALAWRSFDLSRKTELSAKTLAIQYAGYSAEIAARRVDAAVRTEMIRASDDWRQTERRDGAPTFASVREWVAQRGWIVSAIYVPDDDPASSVYVSELAAHDHAVRLSREIFTSSGTMRYTYDPRRLLQAVQDAVKQQPLVRVGAEAGLPIGQRADLTLVLDPHVEGLQRVDDGYRFTAALAPPLQAYGVRAAVRTAYVGGRGWENQRFVSLSVSILAIILTGAGVMLALRGMNKEAETTKLRGALIANVSHELRTPLSMIRLGAETLKLGRLKPQERAEIEDQILREVLLLSHLVENVLDVARMQNRSTKALAFTAVHPRDLIRGLVATYEGWIRSKGFTVALELDESIGPQMWDRDAVSRALLNLIDNAIKYSNDDKAIDVALRETAEHVVIEVKDRGIGIDAKDAARIFDPYYRAKFSDTITRRGAGLGLTLVQQIVHSHGGRVELESQPGAGSTFRLLFPRELADAAADDATDSRRSLGETLAPGLP